MHYAFYYLNISKIHADYLEENIKDETILKGIEDFNGTLLLIAESIGFVKGFKVAAALGARKSALPELNEKLLEREEGNEH